MIRLYPTQAQRDMLKQWFGVARKTYNATVCLFRGHRRVKRSLAEARIPIERRLYKKQYVAAVPYQLRDNAIKDCVTASIAAAKRYQDTGRVTRLSFRSRKDESQSIKPLTKSCKALLDGNSRPRLFQMYSTYMKPIRTKEDIPAFRACQVVMRYGREFYLKADIEYTKPSAPESVDVRRAVGLDPNVKNLFGVWSASEQRMIELPDFAKHNKRVARLTQLHATIKQRRAQRTLTRKRQRAFQKRLGLRDHHHWALINDLLGRYDVVCLPPFEAHRKAETLGSGTNETMFSIAHGLLLARLTYKAESQGKYVLSRGEEYTTQTCSSCGALNKPDDRAYACARCGLAMHRDLNSAKNILVKSLLQL
jgi:transposase